MRVSNKNVKAKKEDWSRDLSAKIQSKDKKFGPQRIRSRSEVRTEKTITEKKLLK